MDGVDCVRARYTGKAMQEWQRLDATPITRIERLITQHCLARHLPGTGLILDAGSGPGRYSIELAQQGYGVVMHDLVREMLDLGQEKVAASSVQGVAGLVEGDIAALPYPDARFDAVMSLGAPLSHIADAASRERAVRELARVVKPGGPVLLTGCGRLAMLRAPVYWMNLADFDQVMRPEARASGIYDGSQLWYTFEPGELAALADAAGLAVVEQVGCEGLASYLPMAHLALIEQDPVRWPLWREVLLATCSEPSIIGMSSHLLVVGRKPEGTEPA